MKQNVEHWIQQAVVYQIYPRSFYDANGDGIGDLQGIIKKLDYLNDGSDKSLGVNAIWLSPIYPSPMKDFGYDVAEYKNVDPIFGTLADFDQLLEAAHQRGIKVLMDYIPNHTSSEHPWFMESKSSVNNPKRDWYIWRDAQPDGSPPNNWLSVFGGSAWEWDEKTQQYYLHSFDKDQPDLNWRNPAVVEEMLGALRFWLDRGVDGFRIDAYDFLFKHESFADEPANPTYILGTHGPHDSLVHIYSFAQPETLEMLKKIAGVLEEYDHKFMVTEVYAKVEKLIEMYSHIQKDWYAPFNFGLIFMPWKADIHRQYIDEYDEKVGHMYWPTYVLGNHDQSRVGTRIGREKLPVAAMLQLTLRGVPFIYYGEEIGMVDGEIPTDKIQDPFEKNSPGLKLGRDPERTPMQWSDEEHAGFSTTEPWLPLASNERSQTVVGQQQQPQSLWQLYRQLISLRSTHKVLQVGSYTSLPVSNENVFVFERKLNDDRVIVVLNYSEEDTVIALPLKKAKVLADTTGEKKGTLLEKLKHLHVLPNQGLILEEVT